MINPNHLKKAELLTYITGRCKHHHFYTEHPSCFTREVLEGGKSQRIGVLDIEFSNFKANYGFILCYAIKEHNKDKISGNCVSPSAIRRFDFDKHLVKKMVNDINKFDQIVTYYGTKCDVPYMRTRCLEHKVKFPFYGYVKHIDLYYLIRYKLQLQSNSLESACQFFGIKGKSHINPRIWLRGSHGSKKDLDEIFEHNLGDVKITDELYNKIINYSRKTQRSL